MKDLVIATRIATTTAMFQLLSLLYWKKIESRLET